LESGDKKVLAFFLEFVGSKFVKKRLQGATKLSSWDSDAIVAVVRCEQRIFGIYVVFPASMHRECQDAISFDHD
jgi:hypothetical protein